MRTPISGQNFKEKQDSYIASMYISPVYVIHCIGFSKSVFCFVLFLLFFPRSRAQSSSLSVWVGFGDCLLVNGVWTGKNCNFTVEKPDRYHCPKWPKLPSWIMSCGFHVFPIWCNKKEHQLCSILIQSNHQKISNNLKFRDILPSTCHYGLTSKS